MQKSFSLIHLLISAVLTLVFVQCNITVRDELDRNPSTIHYSKHARCRMDCRHIDETEVKQLLKEGQINYTKSELKGDVCHKKFAVEGTSHDNQRLRIIFAPCNNEITVVTVIDLGKEWSCNCD